MQEKTPIGARRKKRKRNENGILIGSIIMCIVTLCAITVSLVMVFQYRAAQMENIEVMQQLERAQELEEQSYTEEEVALLLSEKESQTVEKTQNELLSAIKARFEEGESTVRILRAFYPEDIVIADSNQYLFFPIQENLKKHTYKQENLILTQDNLLEYYEEGTKLSHKGIDVSKYQGNIDWEAVADDEVEYAFIRLGIRGYTKGEILKDEKFEENIEGALENGIEAGAYFFTQATSEEEAREEAQFVLDELEPYDITCPIVLDVEKAANEKGRANDLSKEERTKYSLIFCDMIKKAGYTPMIYGNLKTFMLMLDMEQLEEYDKWIAYYDSEMYFPYDFKIWQYTEKGRIDGIKGEVDINISMEEFYKE